MSTKSILTSLLMVICSIAHADRDTPVSPEAQKLAEDLVAGIKSADDTARLACCTCLRLLPRLNKPKQPPRLLQKAKPHHRKT
jgi:hypothetical protein